MDIKTLETIFTAELGGKLENGTIRLPQGTRVTVFLTTPGGVLPVGKVHDLSVGEVFVTFGSDEGRVFAGRGDILAIRADQEASAPRDARLGFG